MLCCSTLFPSVIVVRYFRLEFVTWQGHVSLRWDLLGCGEIGKFHGARLQRSNSCIIFSLLVFLVGNFFIYPSLSSCCFAFSLLSLFFFLFSSAIVASYFRLEVVTWQGHVSLRWDLLGYGEIGKCAIILDDETYPISMFSLVKH